jgi:transcriptional regulator with XRE-family HTH domain
MKTEKVDLAALAVLVRRDRMELNLSQTNYGHRLGLTQGQVSDLERARFVDLSHEVRQRLVRRFKRLPTMRGTEPDRLIQDVQEHAARELGSVFGVIPEHRRVELANHLKRQMTLLAELSRLAARRRQRPRNGDGDPPVLFGGTPPVSTPLG